MENILVHIIITIGLIIATITDIKKREVPDTLNYGLIILGLVMGIITGILGKTWEPIISAAIGLAVGYLIGALMFYTGQWGGGDAKMLMGMGSIIGISWTNITSLWSGVGNIPLFITTIITIFIAGGIYGLFYTFILIIKKWKEFKIEFEKKRSEKKIIKIRKVILGISLITIIAMLFVDTFELKVMLGFMAIIIFCGQYLIIISKIVEKVCMIKTIPIRALTEGEWIVEDIIIDGKRICGPKDLGITNKQIKELKKHNVRRIKIKEGIPFIPGFLLGYILIMVFGNWLAYLL